MRTYRIVWRAVVVILFSVSLVASARSTGWIPVLATAVSISAAGAVAGYAWVQEPAERWRAIRMLAAWFGVGAVLVLGLPSVLGPWSLVVLLAVGGLCPQACCEVLGRRRRKRPVRSSVQAVRIPVWELQQRWTRTGQQLRDRRRDPAAVLALAQEREFLLDELERRDPAGFDTLLVRAGWREQQDH